MSVIRIASRYAKSIIELAQEQNKLERIVDDMNLFNTALENRDLQLMIKSPIISADKKQKVFTALFSDKVDTLTNEFFKIVIKKGREGYLPEIAKDFIKQYKTLKNITTAEVTTATPVDQDQLDKIKSEIVKLNLATGAVEFITKVDPELVGGFVLEINGQAYDASVKTKLANLKKEILDNTYIKSL